MSSTKKILRGWAENASCNGVPNIERSPEHPRKAFWIILVLTGSAMTLYQLVDVIQSYLEYQVNINVNLTSEGAINFPAVTFCNVNPVREGSFFAYVNETPSIAETLELMREIREEIESHKQRRYSKRLFSAIPEDARERMGHQGSTMLLACVYSEDPCSIQNDFFHFLDAEFGNCYTFNTKFRTAQRRISRRTGAYYGLSMDFYLEQEEYISSVTGYAGLRLVIHPTDRLAFPPSEGIYIRPATMTSISIAKVSTLRLPEPHPSACWEASDERAIRKDGYAEKYGGIYTLQGCQRSCSQAWVYERCLCYDPFVVSDTPAVTHWLNESVLALNITPCITIKQVECEEVTTDMVNNQTLECDCNPVCTETYYTTTMSQVDWPYRYAEERYLKHVLEEHPELANTSGQFITKDNILRVEIYYDQLNYECISEVSAMSLWDLLANVGGIFGFYLGISVIALFEFFELLTDLSLHGWNYIHKRGKSAPSEHTSQQSMSTISPSHTTTTLESTEDTTHVHTQMATNPFNS